MASFNGLKKIAATDIQNSGRFYLGNQVDTGTAGQALLSGGPNQPAEWGSHTGNIQPLTAGNHVTFSSGNTTFDGSIPDTINTTAGGGLSGGDGIDIVGATIETDNDEITISNSTSLNRVLRVPYDLTISQNGTTIDTFNGSSAKTIDLEGKYIAGDGIDISGHPVPHIEADTDEVTISHNVGGAEKLQVLKVPNTLTITDSAGSSVIFDGSANESITINDNNDQLNLTAALPMVINNGGGLNREVELQYNAVTLGVIGGALEVLRLPNLLSFTGYATGVYDGSNSLNINLVDTDTTYQGGTGISINTATNPDTINCSNIPNTALQNSTISGVQLGSNLSTLTFYDSGGAFITSYNGAAPPTSVTLPAGGSTYVGGKNITVDTTPNPDEIDLDDDLTGIDSITMTSTSSATAITGNNYPSNPTTCTYLDLSSSTNTFPKFVGGGEILKSLSFIDNPSVQNYNRIYNTANDFIFSGGQEGGSDTLEIDFVATSTSGYCEFGFYANSYNPGMIFMVGIAAATGGTSPFSTTLTSAPVSIDAFKLGLFDGSTNRYSIKEILDFTSYENTFLTSNFFFNNLSVGTRYRMALYGRCYNSGQIVINTGYQGTSGYVNRAAHQPTFMKFYEYDSSIGGARTTGSGGGGGM